MVAKVSDYINAGNIASRQSRDIQAASIRSGSDLSKIPQEAQQQKIKSEIEARKASARVVEAGMIGESRSKGTEQLVAQMESEANEKKGVRKAGSIAAAGALIGEGLYKDPPRPERKAIDYSALDKSLADRKKAAEEALAKATDAEATYLAKNTSSPQSTSSQSTPVASLDINQRALTDTISFAEGTWDSENKKVGYDVAFGGGLYNNMRPHPDRVIESAKVKSAAHGAYQFMPATWRDVHGGNNPPMTPENQDKAAISLALRRGYDFSKPFADQISVLAPEWASFPNAQGRSQYNLDDGSPQPSKRSSTLIDFYNERVRELSGR